MDHGTRDELLSRLAEAVESVTIAHPTRVAIDGVPGAGKTTLADELAVVLRAQGREVIRATIEDFLNPSSVRHPWSDSAEGWYNQSETRLLDELRDNEPRPKGMDFAPLRRAVRRFRYVSLSTLVSLIRGARAVVFPSLYEGFGLPVLEAMALGTPVVTSRESSLPEVAGEAALLVDPYDVDDIARGIWTIANDADLRTELARRGILQAEKFSVERYRERVAALYDSLC